MLPTVEGAAGRALFQAIGQRGDEAGVSHYFNLDGLDPPALCRHLLLA